MKQEYDLIITNLVTNEIRKITDFSFINTSCVDGLLQPLLIYDYVKDYIKLNQPFNISFMYK